MDPVGDSQPTQQATQDVLDPRRFGQQNSGFSDEDVSDIVCILLPYSDSARRMLAETASHSHKHLLSRDEAEYVDFGDGAGGGARANLNMSGDIAIILRLSDQVKSPYEGYTFGRNVGRCDICFYNDAARRLSNIHFRIYLNDYGTLMLEDRSTNGTVVDNIMLKAKSNANALEKQPPRMRTLTHGAKIKILMEQRDHDLEYLVQIPHRDGEYAEAYRQNLIEYLQRIRLMVNDNETIMPGQNGHPDLFPNHQQASTNRPDLQLIKQKTQENVERLPTEWNGSNKYNRVAQIGKGAFAVVYKVTAKYDGKPYAAKELDKKKFMKNGVLDQKVENEMNIMQRIHHPHIVQYIEHFEWDKRLFIIIMDYVPNGDLGRLISDNGPLVENVVQDMAAQLLDALGYLHENAITHRDVKPDNILIQSFNPLNVKLTDFGLSKMVEDGTFLKTFCGTLLYCAPEVYSEYADYDEYGRRDPRNRRRQQPSGRRYDHVIDVWSLGGVLFYAFTGQPPYPVKSGISYSELLHQIMTQDLDVSPLTQGRMSPAGVDFLRHMLQRRPERRATVAMLMTHAWMRKFNLIPSSADAVTDHGLEASASQLRIHDHQENDRISDSADEASVHKRLSELDDFFDEDSPDDKENHTMRQGNTGPKLFGEVGISAIRDSGVFPAGRLNLPVSANNIDSQRFGNEIGDSVDSHLSIPRRKSQSAQQASLPFALAQDQSYNDTSFELNSRASYSSSHSLAGAESYMGNLNMKSLAPSHQPSGLNSFMSSKRKPGFDSSDEFERSGSSDRPTWKRFKSSGQLDSLTSPEDIELSLLAMMPQIRQQTERQFDEPVHKSTYWTANDRDSMHLRYPEMTQLQYDAFVAAANNRGEQFGPGTTPLWNLALTHFPPTNQSEKPTVAGFGSVDLGLSTDNQVLDPSPVPTVEGDEDLPGTMDPDANTNVVVPVVEHPPRSRIVATFCSTPDSIVQDITVTINTAFATWGRGPQNTHIFPLREESRVPLHALKIILWKEGVEPHRNFRPWSSPPGDFYWYISTKATAGIQVNRAPLPSDDPKHKTSPCRNWMRIYDGDEITVWKNNYSAGADCTRMIFNCSWGGSSSPRAAEGEHSEPVLMAQATADRLDTACHKAEKRIVDFFADDARGAEADADVRRRKELIAAERQKSYEFEQHRVDACRLLSARLSSSRRASPAGFASVGPAKQEVVQQQASVQAQAREGSNGARAVHSQGFPSASAPSAMVSTTTTPAYGQFTGAPPKPSPLGGLRNGLVRRQGSPGMSALRAMVGEDRKE